MAKQISKQINSRYLPTFVGGFPVYKYGGRMQYGLGSFLKDNWSAAISPAIGLGSLISGKKANDFTQENAGIIGTVAGGALGTLAGNPMLGAQIGGQVGGRVQGNYMQNHQQDEMMNAQQQQQNQQFQQSLINNLPATTEYVPTFANGGSIHIKPSKRGTFTAAAKKRGMGVQEFASKVTANPENYTEAMRKKAQFAKNASKFKHEMGGEMNPFTSSNNPDMTTYYENGGKHTENPFGGIKIGSNALVEEGEVRFDTDEGESYIFSNKIPFKRK